MQPIPITPAKIVELRADVGDQILAMQRLVEFIEHLAGIDEGFEPRSLDELLFVALPTRAVNEVVIERPVICKKCSRFRPPDLIAL